MKVLMLSTFDQSGGAAVAANRLYVALRKLNIDVQYRYLLKGGRMSKSVRPIFSKYLSWWSWLLFSVERVQVLFTVGRKFLFRYSTGRFGVRISQSPLLADVDVINLHWVSFSMISIDEIKKLALKKPIVWTLHDMWAFTGGCHYSFDCKGYRDGCKSCFYLKKYSLHTSRRVLSKKKNLWNDMSIDMVGVSSWITNEAMTSVVFGQARFHTIPNPIDEGIFIRGVETREPDTPLVILCSAIDFSDPRKGMYFLVEALKIVVQRGIAVKLQVIGKSSENDLDDLDHEFLGLINDLQAMVACYQQADIFVLPSVQDNLPNTVMESMACGTPVVAFDSGGVSDMVLHKSTGYLAENMDADSLAEGIEFLSDGQVRAKASENARRLVEDRFSEKVVAHQYCKVFENAIEVFK